MSNRRKIFLSGTRKVERLPGEVIELLSGFIDSGDEFLVGDAPGSDRAFQRYLSDQRIQNVTVFSSASFVRNNLGAWNTEFVDSGLKSKTNAMHAAKDRRMSATCTNAVMIWDGQSAGTLANLLDVVERAKPAHLYNFLDSELIRFESMDALLGYLESFPEVLDLATKRLKRDKRRRDKVQRTFEEEPETLF